jgi:hypothetical protein
LEVFLSVFSAKKNFEKSWDLFEFFFKTEEMARMYRRCEKCNPIKYMPDFPSNLDDEFTQKLQEGFNGAILLGVL